MSSRNAKLLKWSIAVGLWCLIAYLFLGRFITYRTYDIWVCPITGSTLTHRSYWGRVLPSEHKATALEAWLRERDPEFRPKWQHLSMAVITLGGGTYRCARAPAIYSYRNSLRDFVTHLPEDRVMTLLEVLRRGSKEQQKSALRECSDEVYWKSAR